MISRLVDRLLEGDRRALSRLFTLLEQDADALSSVMAAVNSRVGKAYCIGITGPPGAGKSTIVDGLIQIARAQGSTVGVLAVDPTSPFSGGAVLGDRIRMQRHSLDPGVFMRSLATRGFHGGVSRTARVCVRLLDAFGKDLVFVETVGVGQTELDIMRVADSVVVCLVPEAGDAIQTMKAGLMEIADIFVVNKADRDGARRLATAIGSMLDLKSARSWWTQPVLLTRADRNEGIQELFDSVTDHRRVLQETENLDLRRRQRQREEFVRTLKEAVEVEIAGLLVGDGSLNEMAAKVESGDLDPYSAAAQVLAEGHLFSQLVKEVGDPTDS